MTQPFEPQQTYPQPPAPTAKKAGLLDIHFTKFLSLSLISVWWVVALILIAIAAIVGIISGFTIMGSSGVEGEEGSRPGWGLLLIASSVFGAPIAAVLTRLFLESVAVLFRIANNTSEIASRRQF